MVRQLAETVRYRELVDQTERWSARAVFAEEIDDGGPTNGKRTRVDATTGELVRFRWSNTGAPNVYIGLIYSNGGFNCVAQRPSRSPLPFVNHSIRRRR